MRKIERFVYNRVKSNLFLKDLLRIPAQLFFSVFSKPRGSEKVSNLGIWKHSFFGFHDACPWNSSMSHLLLHEYPARYSGNERTEKVGEVTIVLYGGERWQERTVISKTRAWNWQQGARLQWANDHTFLFNAIEGDQVVCKKYSLLTNSLSALGPAVGSVCQSRGVYASFSYLCFGKGMPAYGYLDLASRYAGLEEDSILELVDMNGKIVRRIDISRSQTNRGADGFGFISHTQFSPSGRYLAFLHRCSRVNMPIASSLLLYSLDEDTIIETPFEVMVSHFCFLGDDRILVYAYHEDSADSFYMYDISNNMVMPCYWMQDEDGHPHADVTGSRIVVDTYPDVSRIQRLKIVSDVPLEPVTDFLGTYKLPMHFNRDSRIDLHPRLSPDCKYIAIDNSVNRQRSFTVLSIDTDLT